MSSDHDQPDAQQRGLDNPSDEPITAAETAAADTTADADLAVAESVAAEVAETSAEVTQTSAVQEPSADVESAADAVEEVADAGAAAAAVVALTEGSDVADAVVRAAGGDDTDAPKKSESATELAAGSESSGESEASESSPVSEAVPTSSTTAIPRTAQEAPAVDASVETIVHVLRHGEVHNPKGILYGRLPGFSLSVAGRAQAAAVSRSLSDHDLALVIASPLQRAQETAEPIAAEHGLIVRTDENLVEAGNTFEGLRVSVGDGALRKPRHWWKLRDPFTPSWGEPYLQIAHRMLAAVNKARVEAAGREAVLVSHQLPVWTLRRFLQGQRLWHDPRQRQCSLASLTSLVYQGDTLVDIVYSEPAGGSDPSVHGA